MKHDKRRITMDEYSPDKFLHRDVTEKIIGIFYDRIQ